MSRSQNLRHNVINQIIDGMTRGHIPSPLPSQSTLAEMYSIGHTTVRRMLSHLNECGVLAQVGSHYVIVRKPDHDDGFACITASMTEQNQTFEQVFSTVINQRQLCVGESFSELQLTRIAGISPVVVREYLLKFERYNLIKNERRGRWSMKRFDQAYTKRLFELREMLETHSLQHFLSLPDGDPRWLQVKTLPGRRRILRDNIDGSFRVSSQLDREFHALLLSAADNVFSDQSLGIISVVSHFHYRWDENDLKQRNITAIDERMTILSVLTCRNNLDATLALCNHLSSTKQSMIRSINQGCSVTH